MRAAIMKRFLFSINVEVYAYVCIRVNCPHLLG